MRKSTGGTRRLPWAMLAAPALAGIPAGILWWLLAPGGLNLITRDSALATGANPATWLPRDLTLGGVLLFAGCLLAVFLVDGRRPRRQAALMLALTGAALGALVAWQAGMAAARLWSPPVDASANASIAFSLRAWPVLLLWPAATAIAVFALEVLDVGGRKRSGTAGGANGLVAEP
ncbi:hypothetical protein ACIQC0_06100 [Pseudarthrobacter sp. NPDC092419]|uniref:hypothetical protein n=1 Tax=Pseudarthrobacter sp. NPDC092419 TaxID=3364414 RepID=UPI00382E0764